MNALVGVASAGSGGSGRARVERLGLGYVTFPGWHPRAAETGCPVFGFAVVHPDGVIVFDTGVGRGYSFIDDLYAPTVVPVVEALAAVGLDERDVVAVVNSHLHFDHCGQNEAFYRHGVSVFVHEAECVAVASIEHYTVPEWASVPDARLRRVRGEEEVAEGVRIIPTPGHTPGHQSLIVDTGAGRIVIAGQCVYKLEEARHRHVALDNMHDSTYEAIGQDSLDRLLSFRPCTLVASHDPTSCAI